MDNDGGVVRYIYTAMKWNAASSQWEAIPGAQKVTLPSETGPAAFFLPADTEYRFQVEMEFNDNEKTVSYDLGTSDPVKSLGDTLPGVTWDKLVYSGADYNIVKGNLIIDLGQKGSKMVDPTYPLQLQIYADQIYDRGVEITGDAPVSVGKENGKELGTATLNLETNRATISLDLQNLYKNTNYTVVVYGYIDLNDGNGLVRRAIGTASFATMQTLGIDARWAITGDLSETISVELKLELQKRALMIRHRTTCGWHML